MDNNLNYYEILEISQSASYEVVRMAYKALALKYHPDKYNGDSTYANNQMQIINEAYDVISNPEKRNRYNEYLIIQRNRNSAKQREETERKQNESRRKEAEDQERKEREQREEQNRQREKDIEKNKIQKHDTVTRVFLGLLGLLLVFLIINIPFIVETPVAKDGNSGDEYKNEQEDLEIKDLEVVMDENYYGTKHTKIVGKIKNNSSTKTYNSIFIEYNMYDMGNSIIETSSILVEEKLPPGEILKFDAFAGGLEITSAKLLSFYGIIDIKDYVEEQEKVLYGDLEFKDLEVIQDENYYGTKHTKIVGKIKNNSSTKTYNSIFIEYNMYDMENSIIETSSILVEEKLPPGEILKFDTFAGGLEITSAKILSISY